MRAGFCGGQKSANPATSTKMWRIYVLPQILFGLEVTQNPDSETKKLEKFQRETMKQIQNLPPNTSNPMTYLLLGLLPIEGALHKSILTTFCTFLRNIDTAEYRIIRRQLAVKDDDSKSWISTVKKLLYKYGLPSAHDLLTEPPSKEIWKRSVKKAIANHYEAELKTEAIKQNSCRYVDLNACSLYTPHHVWTSAASYPREITRAANKVKLLLGVYNVQARRRNFKGETTPNCNLCKSEPENRAHFILKCPSLDSTRKQYMPVIEAIVKTFIPPDTWSDTEIQLQAILDCSKLTKNNKNIQDIETETRKLLYALHLERTSQLAHASNQPTTQPPPNQHTAELPPPQPPPTIAVLRPRHSSSATALPSGQWGASS